MSLPNVHISFENGAIGAVSPSDDGVVGLVATGTAVAGKLALNTPTLITSLSDLADLGVTSALDDANKLLYKTVQEFYLEAPAASKLWIMTVADTVTLSDIVDVDNDNAKALILAARGDINMLIVVTSDPAGYSPTIADALDASVYSALGKAQALAEWATTDLYAPLFVVIEGRHYTGTAANLKDLHSYEYNRVGVFIGDTISGSTGAALGLVAGRIAAIPVQRSIARVKTGAIAVDVIYITNKVAELSSPQTIDAAGYITARTFVGKSGYYFSNDWLSTKISDDYTLIPRRRVIDKAYRIAYQTLVNELSDEVPLTSEGKIPASRCKNLQMTIENAIANSMTAAGNIGVEQGSAESGVTCYIDENQNVAASEKIDISLEVMPYGYSKYLQVKLGYSTSNS